MTPLNVTWIWITLAVWAAMVSTAKFSLSGSRLSSPPGTTSGHLSVRLHYKEINILLNGGFRFDFSNGWSYTLIYTHFMLIIFMSLKLMCDNSSQSLLSNLCHKRGEKQTDPPSLKCCFRKQSLATIVAH